MSQQTYLNNRYQLMGLLGKGPCGEVYHATDVQYRKEIALKILHEGTESRNFFQYFESNFTQQSKLLNQLSHPSIIDIYDFTLINDCPAWTMDLYRGDNLSQFSGKCLSIEQAANILIPIADTLAYTNQYGLIHGNLKPNNILFGFSQNLILTDFGMASWLSHNGCGYGAFEAEHGIGSPDYLAPEQGLGKAADGRTDVYSLGIILYELLTGIRPFSSLHPIDTMKRQISEQLPPPRYYNPGITPQTEQLIVRATEKNPSYRISSMSEFAMILRDIAAPTSTNAYYLQGNNSFPAETLENDIDDDEDIPGIIKKNFASPKVILIIIFALIGLIVALGIILIINSNNRKEAENFMVQTQTEVMAEVTQTFQALYENQEQTHEAERVMIEQTMSAVEIEETASADVLPAIPPTEPVTFVSIPTAIPTAVSQASGRFQSQTPADGASFVVGEAFDLTWTLENTGSTNWSSTYKLVFDSGYNFTENEITEQYTGVEIWPNGAAGLTLPCVAPDTSGSYFMQWHVVDDNGNTAFSPLTITINVYEEAMTATPVPTETPTPTATEAIEETDEEAVE